MLLFSVTKEDVSRAKCLKRSLQDNQGGQQMIYHVISTVDSLQNPFSECELRGSCSRCEAGPFRGC
jgi:hypothetical protein